MYLGTPGSCESSAGCEFFPVLSVYGLIQSFVRMDFPLHRLRAIRARVISYVRPPVRVCHLVNLSDLTWYLGEAYHVIVWAIFGSTSQTVLCQIMQLGIVPGKMRTESSLLHVARDLGGFAFRNFTYRSLVMRRLVIT